MSASYLKQSTASQSRAIGPFLDDTDFKSAETGLTIANTDIKLVINGAASANKNSGGGTHRVNGVYSITFDATDTATVGEMEVSVVVAGALPVFHKFWVLEEAVYDAMFGASALGYIANAPVNVAQFGGSNLTASSGIPSVNISQISGDSTAADNAEAFFDGTGYAGTNNVIPTVSSVTAIATGGITAGSIAADAIGASELAADAVTEIQSGLATASALSTAQGDITAILADTNELQTDWVNGGRLDLILDARASQTSVDDLPTNAELSTALAGADDATLAAIAALNNLSAAQVNAEVDTALADINLDHLVKNAVDTDWATTVHLNSVIGHVADNGTSATFDRTTDSLEALQAEHDATQSALTTIDGIVDAIVDDTNSEIPMTLSTIASTVDAILTDTGTTLPATLAAIEGDTQDIQGRIPAALVGGRIDATIDATGLESGALALINAEVDTALADIHLDHLLATDYDPASKPGTATALLNELVESDAGVSRFTANALEQAPTGGSAPTAADIRAEIDSNSTQLAAIVADTNELQTDWANGGRLDNLLDGAASAGDPWTTALPGAYGAGTAGKIIGDNINATISSRASQTSVDDLPTNAELATALGTADDAVLAAVAGVDAKVDILDTNVDAILVDTAEIGAAGAGLTALATAAELAKVPKSDSNVTWNATAAAQIQSEANDALVAYDPPTRTELTSDTNSILTAVGDVPTNAELATALAGADDAVLAAIAALNNLDAAGIRTALGMASANLDTQLADLPTNSELATALGTADDAVLAAVAALNNLSAADAQTAAAAALTAYDPPTRAELTSDTNSILTAVGDVPTNAELATALGTADDAVLAAVATVDGNVDTLVTQVDELHKIAGLDSGNPMTVTTSSREAGAIELVITGDGETTTTVTRQ